MSDSFATSWTAGHQAPLSMGFPRQEYWSGLPFPPPEGLSNPGMESKSLVPPALADDSLPLSHQGSSKWVQRRRKEKGQVQHHRVWGPMIHLLMGRKQRIDPPPQLQDCEMFRSLDSENHPYNSLRSTQQAGRDVY